MQTSLLDDPDSKSTEHQFETVKSWASFKKLIGDAKRLWAVTYCDTPSVIAKLFDELDLQRLELVVGDVSDYRERLTEEDIGLTSRLERLKRSGELEVYTCPTRTVHSKMYLMDLDGGQDLEEGPPDGRFRLLDGSANLTKNSWTNHTNHFSVYEVPRQGEIFRAFRADYCEHREYGERFLDDLTERIASQDSEDREEVIRHWVAGRESSRDPMEEANAKLASQVIENHQEGKDRQTEEEITLSLHGYESDFETEIKDEVQHLGGRAGPDSVKMGPSTYGKFLDRHYGVPGLWIDDGEIYLTPSGGKTRTLRKPPPSDAEEIGSALAHLEQYLETVDRHGQTNEPEAVKAHMLEVVLYFLWAPFATEHAQMLTRRGVSSLDKRLPFLYLQGESNSGKGTILEFGLRLISQGTVTSPADADEIGVKSIRALRQSQSAFPFAVDDIEKDKIRRLDPLRNYWARWEPEKQYPTLIFTSNDRKPQKWFRNRSKMLALDVMFDPGPEAEAEVQRIVGRESSLFGWIAQDLIERYSSGVVEMEKDALWPARRSLIRLYEQAGRDRPDYLTETPAEKRYDPGRRAWRRLSREQLFDIESRQDKLYVEFAEEMRTWKIAEFRRKLPTRIRAEQEGRRIVIRSPSQFETWIGELGGKGIADRIASLFGLR
ncbi:phospholipase D family protein [Salinibacter ruber]|uniref:phospholipase D family protein n=1 Tax=Salinibacter ruber TaxID=146919 RepID=UPI000E6BE0CE|nr:phospholipase D family protein [Salinibacter ruber]